MSIRLRALAVACAVLAAGCALGTQRFGREIDAQQIASLEIGTSTKADVLRLFGPPTAYSALPPVAVASDATRESSPRLEEPDARVFEYQYREDRESFFTVILFTRFRREVSTDRLVVFFDERDVVRYVGYARETGGAP